MTILPERRYRWPAAAVPYRWRDPDHLTPAQLEALAARDRPEPPPAPDPVPRDATRRRRFAEAREAGLTVEAAARQAGASRMSGTRWERMRREGNLLAR